MRGMGMKPRDEEGMAENAIPTLGGIAFSAIPAEDRAHSPCSDPIFLGL